MAQFYQELSRANYWVAVNDKDEVIGGVGIGPFGQKNDVCELQKLYVAPPARGKGVAKELMKVALTFAQEHYAYCYLETLDKLQIANRLYTTFGFKQLEEPLEGTEHNACDTWYIKQLS